MFEFGFNHYECCSAAAQTEREYRYLLEKASIKLESLSRRDLSQRHKEAGELADKIKKVLDNK